MQYAILCYDDETVIEAWSKARDEEVIGRHRAYARQLGEHEDLWGGMKRRMS